jgi:hypothetical protein
MGQLTRRPPAALPLLQSFAAAAAASPALPPAQALWSRATPTTA